MPEKYYRTARWMVKVDLLPFPTGGFLGSMSVFMDVSEVCIVFLNTHMFVHICGWVPLNELNRSFTTKLHFRRRNCGTCTAPIYSISFQKSPPQILQCFSALLAVMSSCVVLVSMDSREIFWGGRMAFDQHFFSLNLFGLEEMSFGEISR